jgi:hypothetical protein
VSIWEFFVQKQSKKFYKKRFFGKKHNLETKISPLRQTKFLKFPKNPQIPQFPQIFTSSISLKSPNTSNLQKSLGSSTWFPITVKIRFLLLKIYRTFSGAPQLLTIWRTSLEDFTTMQFQINDGLASSTKLRRTVEKVMIGGGCLG